MKRKRAETGGETRKPGGSMQHTELKGSVTNAKLWLPIEEIESAALTQLRNTASLPWAVHVAVMPDCHFGKGATVGSVIGLRGAVSPAAVGVDIGCGMLAVRTSLRASLLPDSLGALRSRIEESIPVGFSGHASSRTFPQAFRHGRLQKRLRSLLDTFRDLHPGVQKLSQKALTQLGSLGGGNHFIELCIDTEQWVWFMMHSGSRNIGKSLADLHISAARKLAHNRRLPDPDLAVFLSGTPEMKVYRRDLNWAQEYAALNRLVMAEIFKEILYSFFSRVEFGEAIQCHHNYVAEEVHFGEELFVTRKGAISARAGEPGIIPGSMGTKSFIVRGLGNAQSLMSASHGAGRRMSRNAARKRFTRADLIAQTEGVECRKDGGVLDEIPGAYKNINDVIQRQSDLVELTAELKQVLCVKG